MITLIHGDDVTASRNFLFDLRKKSKEPTSLNGATVTVTDLAQVLEGSDLFGSSKEIFIDELLSKRKSSKELDAIISQIVGTSHNVTLWESKVLTKTQLKQFNQITIKQFSIPKVIFNFLDHLRPNNSNELIKLFHAILEEKDAEFVLFMLQRQIRLLLACHSEQNKESLSKNVILGTSETRTPESTQLSDSGQVLRQAQDKNSEQSRIARMTISELTRLAPWQMSKLKKQASLFNEEQLINLHQQLYYLELGMKTGGLSLPLDQSLDFFLLSF